MIEMPEPMVQSYESSELSAVTALVISISFT